MLVFGAGLPSLVLPGLWLCLPWSDEGVIQLTLSSL